MQEKIIELFHKGFSDKEIAQETDINYYQIGQQLKILGLVRTPEQLREIKLRCQRKTPKKKCVKLPKDTKNYIIDDAKWLIKSTPETFENDIEASIQQIQKLRKNYGVHKPKNVKKES